MISLFPTRNHHLQLCALQIEKLEEAFQAGGTATAADDQSAVESHSQFARLPVPWMHFGQGNAAGIDNAPVPRTGRVLTRNADATGGREFMRCI